jgi:hypothetical protein
MLRWLGPASWLDVTAPAGLVLCAAMWCAIALALQAGASPEAWLCGGLLASSMLVNGAQLRGATSHASALLRLSKLGHVLQSRGVHNELWVMSSASSRTLPRAPRLVLQPPAISGFERLELRAPRPHRLDPKRAALVFVAASRPGSPADASLAEALPDAYIVHREHLIERRATTTAPARDILGLLERLQRSTGLRQAA